VGRVFNHKATHFINILITVHTIYLWSAQKYDRCYMALQTLGASLATTRRARPEQWVNQSISFYIN